MSRVAKTDPRLVAYADVDEANSALGVALALGRARRRGRRPAAQRPERPVRRRRRPVHAGRAGPGVPAAADHRGLHRAARGGLRRVQRGAAEAGQLHPARRHAGRRAAAPGPRRSSGGPSAAPGRCWPPTPSAPTRDRALPQPAVGPAVHPGPRRQPRRRRAVGARRAQRRPRPAAAGSASPRGLSARAAAPTPPRRGSRSPSSCPSPARAVPPAVRAWSGRRRPTGSARSSRPGLAPGLHLELGPAEPLLRAHRQRQPAVPEQHVAAVPGDADRPAGRAGPGAATSVTAPRPESRNRRRSRKATTTTTTQRDAEQDEQDRGHGRPGGRRRCRISGGSGVLAGGPQPGLRPAGGVEGLRVVASLLGAAQRLAGALRRRSRWRSPRSRRGWTRRAR